MGYFIMEAIHLARRRSSQVARAAFMLMCSHASLLKRAARSSFMPDTMVFPGGAVDSEDVVSASILLGTSSDDADSTLQGSAGLEAIVRCCAVREVFEESGIGIFEPHLRCPHSEDLLMWRDRVHNHAGLFRDMCHTLGVSPATRSLCYWCSFITPDPEHERLKKGGFDARFYVWCAPSATAGATSQVRRALADAQETTELVWVTPKEALAAAAEGHISMVPPQWYILRELADMCPNMDAVPGYAGSAERILQRDYPIKPYAISLTATERLRIMNRVVDTKQIEDQKPTNIYSLVYPGDEYHAVFPGSSGSRHRMNIVGDLGKRAKYELERVFSSADLPLKEAQSGWHLLAKL